MTDREPAEDSMTPGATVWRFARVLVLATTTVWAFRQVLRLTMEKRFSLDEFQYAHAAWALAHGQVQYRDFFEVHFPLAYQYMSLVYRFGSDDPAAILGMRGLMLPVMLLIGWAAWQINARHGRDWALLGPILLFTLLPFTEHATEIRHDPVAFSLFLGSIACLYAPWPGPRVRAFVAGVMLGLCCWGTQKAFVYASIFLPALLADMFVARKRGGPYLLADPRYFLGGSLFVVAGVAIDLSIDRNWAPMWHWCFAWAADYQHRYQSFSWMDYLVPMVRDLWWYLIFAAVGMVSAARGLARTGGGAAPDHLLLGALFTTFASMSLQQAPWPYSAVPFLGVVGVLAARGLIVTFAWFGELQAHGRGSGLFLGGTLTVLLAFTFWRSQERVEERLRPPDRYDLQALRARYFDPERQDLAGLPDSAGGERFGDPTPGELETLLLQEPRWLRFEQEPEWAGLVEPHNEYQLRVLRKIGELTDVDDAIYDNTGSYVARPHAYFFFYTEKTIRRDKALMLQKEVPAALIENQAVMVVHDSRFGELPKPLKEWLVAHYQPYNGDLWLWGSRLEQPRTEFRAIKTGTYRVYPAKMARGGGLRVDGEVVDAATFELEAGVHQIELEDGDGGAYLLWVPRNGEEWKPNRKAKPHFTSLF